MTSDSGLASQETDYAREIQEVLGVVRAIPPVTLRGGTRHGCRCGATAATVAPRTSDGHRNTPPWPAARRSRFADYV